MAEFFYYTAMIFAGGALYASYDHIDIFISLFCHCTVFFCGFITLSTEILRKKDTPKLILGVVLVAVRAAILRPFVAGYDRLLIYILLDAVCVKRFLPKNVWGVAVPVYYAVVAEFVLLTMRGFFGKNKKRYLIFCKKS